MNRMIRLFQQKADNALETLSMLRKKPVLSAILLLPADRQDDFESEAAIKLRQECVLKAQAEVWQKAADLLRKEELSK